VELRLRPKLPLFRSFILVGRDLQTFRCCQSGVKKGASGQELRRRFISVLPVITCTSWSCQILKPAVLSANLNLEDYPHPFSLFRSSPESGEANC
jgi:hypothetical protein